MSPIRKKRLYRRIKRAFLDSKFLRKEAPVILLFCIFIVLLIYLVTKII